MERKDWREKRERIGGGYIGQKERGERETERVEVK